MTSAEIISHYRDRRGLSGFALEYAVRRHVLLLSMLDPEDARELEKALPKREGSAAG